MSPDARLYIACICCVYGIHTHSVTVGATDSEDKMSTFSNYGECVDIFAPVS